MKINFSETRFKQLLEEARNKEISIPKLINQILETHYKYSYKGVEQNVGNKGKSE